MFGQKVGPENPFKTKQQKAQKNTLTGYVEPSHISQFQFETQRRTFNSYGQSVCDTFLSVYYIC